jgi:hypothetical protein
MKRRNEKVIGPRARVVVVIRLTLMISKPTT